MQLIKQIPQIVIHKYISLLKLNSGSTDTSYNVH